MEKRVRYIDLLPYPDAKDQMKTALPKPTAVGGDGWEVIQREHT